MAEGTALDKRFFLLVGAARGGTTLLTNCLDSHPAIRCLRESGDHRLLGQRDLVYAALRRLARVPGLGGATAVLDRAASLRPERQVVHGGRRQPLAVFQAETYHASLQRKLVKAAKPVCGNKIIAETLARVYRPPVIALEPAGVDRFAARRRERLDYFFNKLFAGYQVVFICRDGRRVVPSKMKRERASLQTSAACWLESARIHQTLTELAGGRLLTVRFEDLVGDPAQTLGRVCEFLRVAYDEHMLAGAQRPYLREVNFGFDREKIAATSDPQLDRVLHDGLVYFGYPVSGAVEGMATAAFDLQFKSLNHEGHEG